MALSGFLRNVVLAVWCALILGQDVAAQDICAKFNIGGPCSLLPEDRNLQISFTEASSSTPENPYCILACTQENASKLSKFCRCAAALITQTATTESSTTTTTMSTTTPRPATCYYSTKRPARLNTVSRRLYSSVPAAPECEYPGIVGLFYDLLGKSKLACMALILSEDILLISESSCLMRVQSSATYLLADTYKLSGLTKNILVNPYTTKKLDSSGTLGALYTVQLRTKLTFNNACIQPVCIPNANIPEKDIDLNDCRIVGYGITTSDTTAAPPQQLMEIAVIVNSGSIARGNLTVTRVNKVTGSSCRGDETAPVICSHKITREWVTVGVTVTTVSPCAGAMNAKPAVVNLMQESSTKGYYNSLQTYKYVNPDMFTT